MIKRGMRYRLYAVRIFSFEWEAALAFYRETLGLPLAFVDAEMGWAQFEVGEEVFLGLERCDPDDPASKELVGRFVGTSIAVDDIDEVCESLVAQGVEFVGPPEKQPWGGTLAHLRDPDGNVLTLLGGS